MIRIETMQATGNSEDEAKVEPPIQLPPSLSRIVLTGFMGAGKSTVGRLLAKRLGWAFVDLDRHLEARTGLSVAEIFTQRGEDHFRRLESTALTSALALPRTVLALGGGTPESLTNRLLLEQTPNTVVVFLDAPFSTLFDRCVLQSLSRPVLNDPVAAQERFTVRHPIYRRLARHIVDTSAIESGKVVEAVLAEIVPALALRGRTTLPG